MGAPKWPKWRARGASELPDGGPRTPKDAPKCRNGIPETPNGGPMGAKRGPKARQREPQGGKMEPGSEYKGNCAYETNLRKPRKIEVFNGLRNQGAPKLKPKWSPGRSARGLGSHGHPQVAKVGGQRGQWSPTWKPKGAPGGFQMPKWAPRGPKWRAKGTKRGPKAHQREPQGEQNGAQEAAGRTPRMFQKTMENIRENKVFVRFEQPAPSQKGSPSGPVTDPAARREPRGPKEAPQGPTWRP